MKVEDLFNQPNIVELSFFNFRNAITAAYFTNRDFEILRINENFRKFFPVLGNVIDSSDIRAAIEELRHIQEEFEQQFEGE